MNTKSTRHTFGRHFKSLLQEKNKSGPLSIDDGPTPGTSPGLLRGAPTFRSLLSRRPPGRSDTALAQFQSRPPDLPGLRAARPRSSSNLPSDPRGGPSPQLPEGHPHTQTPTSPHPISNRFASYSQTRQNSNLAPPHL